MNHDEYRSYDAIGLAGLVGAGQVSPGELLDCALAAVDELNPEINAIVAMFADEARQAIDAGLPDGPLRGVPYAMKDLWATMAGQTTTNGSRLFAGAVADHDAEVVRRYRAAGLVLFAKTNTPEMGLSPSTEPKLFGPTRNPWNRDHSPGGSSGGAAAAVAAGILPAAHASDGGGSIRIPASSCGLFGMKPTRARISAGPDRGEGWGGMSTQHAVSRTVRDSAALLDATAGPMSGDPYWAPPPDGTFLEKVGQAPPSLRIGLCVTAPNAAPVAGESLAAAESTGRKLESLGHRVEIFTWPFGPELLAKPQTSIIGPNIAASIQTRLAQLGRELLDDDLEPVTAAIAARGRSTFAVDYVAAIAAMHQIGREMARAFETVDVLVTPTTGAPPPPLGVLDGSDVSRFGREVVTYTAFTSLANITGQPAMSLPLDRSGDGLPIGTQVYGRFGDEGLLFQLAGQVEEAFPWSFLWDKTTG